MAGKSLPGPFSLADLAEGRPAVRQHSRRSAVPGSSATHGAAAMTFPAGATIAHYRIVSHLGTGGMGEVYRASDTKLGREVAVKVLPEAFARDPDRLARFEREARLLAALNHPNIAAIYGLEQSDGVPVLVLELVPGPTLAGLLAAGPLEVPEALRVCGQIAEAL